MTSATSSKTENYALITGGSDRIGKGIALELAKRGYNLLVHYNSSVEKAEQVRKEAEHFGIKAETIQFNFLENIDYDTVFTELKNRGIVIEVLVNSASEFRPSSFENAGSDLLHRELKINFENAYLLTKSFARVYHSGLIVNLLDTKIEKNFTNHLDYLLSKKLLKEFTKLSAVQLAPDIRVNAIAPGLILPPNDKDEQYLHKLAQTLPLKTIGSLEEILKAFRFLLDSYFVTGQILYIDGGDHLI